jgi:hypothetical protein
VKGGGTEGEEVPEAAGETRGKERAGVAHEQGDQVLLKLHWQTWHTAQLSFVFLSSSDVGDVAGLLFLGDFFASCSLVVGLEGTRCVRLGVSM